MDLVDDPAEIIRNYSAKVAGASLTCTGGSFDKASKLAIQSSELNSNRNLFASLKLLMNGLTAEMESAAG
jgi:hypothetical protein